MPWARWVGASCGVGAGSPSGAPAGRPAAAAGAVWGRLWGVPLGTARWAPGRTPSGEPEERAVFAVPRVGQGAGCLQSPAQSGDRSAADPGAGGGRGLGGAPGVARAAREPRVAGNSYARLPPLRGSGLGGFQPVPAVWGLPPCRLQAWQDSGPSECRWVGRERPWAGGGGGGILELVLD